MRPRNARLNMTHQSPASDPRPGIVADGYRRLASCVESDARCIVEAKYADEWNASGFVQRLALKRKMKAEISDIVTETLPDVSPDALF